MQTQDQEKYIPSIQGEKILGVKRSLFFYYVDSGQIRKQKREGGVDLYNYEDILKVKEKRDRKKKKLVTEVDWMKLSDLPAILKLDFEVYGEKIVGDLGLYVSWNKKNTRLTLVSYERNNRDNILCYICMIPLPEKVILSILAGERPELSISPDEIETYDRLGGYTLLAESVVTHPQHPEQLNSVLRALLEYWCEQYPERYIEKIYAQAASEKGDILIRKLFFSPLYYLSDNAYVLDFKKPGISRIVKEYQEHIKNRECSEDTQKPQSNSRKAK